VVRCPVTGRNQRRIADAGKRRRDTARVLERTKGDLVPVLGHSRQFGWTHSRRVVTRGGGEREEGGSVPRSGSRASLSCRVSPATCARRFLLPRLVSTAVIWNPAPRRRRPRRPRRRRRRRQRRLDSNPFPSWTLGAEEAVPPKKRCYATKVEDRERHHEDQNARGQDRAR